MKFVFIVILLCCTTGIIAQKSVDKADEAFNASAYNLAIELYKQAYSKLNEAPELKARITFNVGYCYRRLNMSDHAELWLGKSVSLRYPNPLVNLYYADALMVNEKYDEATKQYEKYREQVKNDPRAENGIRSCALSKEWTKKPTPYKVVNNVFVNSDNSDYAPVFANEQGTEMVFTSSRAGTIGEKIHEGSGQPFSDLFTSSKNDKGEWSVPQMLDKTLNTEVEEGSPSFTGDFSFMYFTRCDFHARKKSYCKVYSAKRSGTAWENVNEVEFYDFEVDTFFIAHPSITHDQLKLYFVSDLPGGYGGFDIWYSDRAKSDEPWNKPVNAGSTINTKGNEMFPYIREDSILYFSSDGHYGMGGLDIFRVNKDVKGKPQIVNLMYPINSPADDYGIVFEKSLERGFFSSNRKGSKGRDDIWQFSLKALKFNVSGTVKGEGSDNPLAGVKVKLIGNDGSSLETETNALGFYTFKLKPSTNYIVMASQKEYLNTKGKLTTDGLEESKEFKLDLYMNSINIPIEIPNIMFDVGRWDLRPESVVSLEKLVDVLNDNPQVTVEIGSHTDYRPGGKISNQEISQNRAQSVVDFLIIKGIDGRRLSPKGYGDSKPKTVDRKNTYQYPFMKEGQLLNKSLIESLPPEQREMAHQVNRRAEFKVMTSDFAK